MYWHLNTNIETPIHPNMLAHPCPSFPGLLHIAPSLARKKELNTWAKLMPMDENSFLIVE
jgi:hypothetical protein